MHKILHLQLTVHRFHAHELTTMCSWCRLLDVHFALIQDSRSHLQVTRHSWHAGTAVCSCFGLWGTLLCVMSQLMEVNKCIRGTYCMGLHRQKKWRQWKRNYSCAWIGTYALLQSQWSWSWSLSPIALLYWFQARSQFLFLCCHTASSTSYTSSHHLLQVDYMTIQNRFYQIYQNVYKETVELHIIEHLLAVEHLIYYCILQRNLWG